MVKELQRKYGFEVLLLSVDDERGYSGGGEQDKQTLAKHNISWKNVLVPKSWDGVLGTFNIDGYGLALIDERGKVLGVDLHADELEDLMK